VSQGHTLECISNNKIGRNQNIVNPKKAYLANLTKWTLKELEEIDTQFNRIIKRISYTMTTQANDLTYIDQNVGGNGIKPFSEIIQTNKWGMHLRVARNTGPARHAAKGLLGRAARHLGTYATQYQTTTLNTTNSKDLDCWAGSIIQYLKKSDQSLHQGGYTPTLLDTPTYLNKPNTAQARLLAHNEIATIGDTYAIPPKDVPIDWDNLETALLLRLIKPFQTKAKTWLDEQYEGDHEEIYKTARIRHIWFSTTNPNIAYEIKG
jgi:hypothetical protein